MGQKTVAPKTRPVLRLVKTNEPLTVRSLNDEIALYALGMLGAVSLPGDRKLTRWQRFHRWAGLSAPSIPLAHIFVKHVATHAGATVTSSHDTTLWRRLGYSVQLNHAQIGDLVIFHPTPSDWRTGSMGFFIRDTHGHIHTLTADHRSVVRPVRRPISDVRDIRRLEPISHGENSARRNTYS